MFRRTRQADSRRRRLFLETLEPRCLLASIQLLSIPTATSSGWARSGSWTDEFVDGDEHVVQFYADGLAQVPSFAHEEVGSGSYSFSGPLTFKVVPSHHDEVGAKAKVRIDWNYYASWDLDPLHPGGVWGVDQGGENSVYVNMSMASVGKMVDFNRGEEPGPYKGLWWSADTGGGPDEEDKRSVVVEVGSTYTINVNAGGWSKGLWAGGTSFHGGTFTSLDLSVSLKTELPDIAVELRPREAGGVNLIYSVNNSPPQSEIELFWAKKSSRTGLLTTMGQPFWSIATPSSSSADDRVDIELDSFRRPSKNATHVVAVADNQREIREAIESNNTSAIPVYSDVSIDLGVFGFSPAAPFSPDVCDGCETGEVFKRDIYTLVAQTTNHGGAYPISVSFGYKEEVIDGEPRNLNPKTANKTNIKPTVLPPTKTKNVTLDVISKTWDWIPEDDSYIDLDRKTDDALDMAGGLSEFITDAPKLLKFAGTLGAWLDVVNILYPIMAQQKEITLEYQANLTKPEELDYVEDSTQLEVRVPEALKSKLHEATFDKVRTELAKGVMWQSAIPALLAAPATGGLSLLFPLSMWALAEVSEKDADLTYSQAFDPPDPNYNRFASLQFDPLPSEIEEMGGLARSWVGAQSMRHSLKQAEGVSRDRAFGAGAAADWWWRSEQLIAASGFSTAGAALDARMSVFNSLSRPVQNAYAENENELNDLVKDDVPQDAKDWMLAHGMTAEEIEERRQGLTDVGFAELLGNDHIGVILQGNALTAGLSALDEIREAVRIRRDELGMPVTEVSNSLQLRIGDLDTAVGSRSGLPPSPQLLEDLQQLLYAVREAILQTNDIERYESQFVWAYDQLFQFQGLDFSIGPVRELLDDMESTGDAEPTVGASLRGFLDSAQDALSDGLFDSAESSLADFHSLAVAERGVGLTPAYKVDDLVGPIALLLETLRGPELGPALVRTAQPISAFEGDAPQTVALDHFVHDLDAAVPLTWSVVEVSDSNIVRASIDGDDLTVSFLASDFYHSDVATITLRATDNDGKSVDLDIPVTIYETWTALEIGEVPDQAVDEGRLLEFEVDALGLSLSQIEDNFRFRLMTDLPGGATIDEHGRFTWFTTDELGGQTFDVRLEVDRTTSAPETFVREFQISVKDTLEPPALSLIGDFRVLTGQAIEFTAESIDYDVPAETIDYGLVGAPVDASIDTLTGEFNWTPSQPGVFSFEVEARDSSGLSHLQPVTVEAFDGVIPPVDVDLTPSFTVIQNGMGVWGETLAVLAAVRNQGNESSPTFDLGWRLSPSPTGTPNDVPLPLADGTELMLWDELAANRTTNRVQAVLQLPDNRPDGWSGDDFWVLPIVDPTNAIVETDETNNGSSGVQFVDVDAIEIHSALPDLAARRVEGPTSPIGWGAVISTAVQVINTGMARSNDFTVQWYLSRDAAGSADDVLLTTPEGDSEFDFEGLAPGATTLLFERQLQLPAPGDLDWNTDRVHLVPKVDTRGQTDESDEQNNFGQKGIYIDLLPLTLLGPDLVATVIASGDSYQWGQEITALTGIENLGGASAADSHVRYYLLNDPSDPTDAVPLASSSGQEVFGVQALDPHYGDAYATNLDVALVLPETLPVGWEGDEYWLLAAADAEEEIDELFEDNNRVGLHRVLVYDESDLRADLTGSTSASSEEFAWGEVLDAQVHVSNSGDTDAASFKIRWFLSWDDTGSPDDIPLETESGDLSSDYEGVDAGETGPALAERLVLPDRQPAGWGAFHVVALVDSEDEIDERLESNNFKNGRGISVTQQRADLQGTISSVDAPPQDYERRTVPTTAWGEPVMVEGSVFNFGETATDDFLLKWFLSEDRDLSQDDLAVRFSDGADALTVSGLDDVNGDYQFDFEFELLLPDAPSSGWTGPESYLLLSIDSEEVIDESSEANNLERIELYVTQSTQPDLRGAYFLIDSDEVRWGAPVDLVTQVQNAGNADVTNTIELQFFLSQDELVSGDDILLELDDGTDTHEVTRDLSGRPWFGNLPFSRFSLSLNEFVTVELPPKPTGWDGGQFWIIMQTDPSDAIDESNETNNAGQRGQFLDRDVFEIASRTWHNSDSPHDVDASNAVTVVDALAVIQALRTHGIGADLPAEGPGPGEAMVDVNNNSKIDLIDAFRVINEVRTILNGGGEGEWAWLPPLQVNRVIGNSSGFALRQARFFWEVDYVFSLDDELDLEFGPLMEDVDWLTELFATKQGI